MIVSLRTRLLSGVIIGTAVLLAILCTSVYVFARRNVIHQFDKSLLATAKLLSAVIEDESFERKEDGGEHEGEVKDEGSEKSAERGLEFEFDVRMTPEFNNLDGGAYYQFRSQDGGWTVRSPSLGPRDLPQIEGALTTPAYHECILPDGKRGRSVSLRFVPRRAEHDEERLEGKILTLAVAKDASDLHDFLRFMKWLLFGSSLIMIVLSTGLGLTVTRTGLRPIRVLANGIESVHEGNLGRRFSKDAYPVELLPICECLNALLERLRSSFEREQRFNADVAHELRTPLAGVQSVIEVCLSRRREPKEYQDSLQSCLEIAKSMHKMIDTLLSLAKSESRRISARSQTVHLKSLIEYHWRNFADKAYDRNLTFENFLDDDVTCTSDKEHLGMIVSNILDNAVEYSNEGGRIRVEAKKAENLLLLSISNTGCELTGQDVEHVFDSFWRYDESRTETGRHSGIGLTVVRKMAEALGIKVEADLEQQGLFAIRLHLPSS